MGKALVKFTYGEVKGEIEVFCDNEDSNDRILDQAKNLINKKAKPQEGMKIRASVVRREYDR